MEKREIKFRAWDNINKRFARQSTYVRTDGQLQFLSQRVVYKKQYEFAGQFTGLYDKNGKEIYEGDVLKLGYPINGADGEPDYLPITVTIHFQGGAFWFTGDGYTDCNWHFYSGEHREIIGNIYESPELLNKL